MSKPDREAMLDRGHPGLSIRRQCALLSLARSGVYRPKRPANDDDLALMRRLDELFLAHPFLGSRRMAAMLRAEGRPINRKRVQRLMRLMGIAAIGPKPRTSKPAPGHKVYPYLLRDMVIDRPNQVWAADITYLPMARGFLYLVAIIDWASRAVLAWRLSNSLDVSFCLEALDEALARFGKPEIFNTDPFAACWPHPLRGSDRWSPDHRWQPIHQRGLHRPAPGCRCPHLDGRAWSLARQRLRRAAVALAQVRGGAPQGLRRWPRSQSWHRRLGDLLQHAEAPSGVGQSCSDGRMAGRPHRPPAGQHCGHDAALGRRWRVAHMPTATAAADSRGVRNKTEPGVSNQAGSVCGPGDGVQLTTAPEATSIHTPANRVTRIPTERRATIRSSRDRAVIRGVTEGRDPDPSAGTGGCRETRWIIRNATGARKGVSFLSFGRAWHAYHPRSSKAPSGRHCSPLRSLKKPAGWCAAISPTRKRG